MSDRYGCEGVYVSIYRMTGWGGMAAPGDDEPDSDGDSGAEGV